MRDPVQIKKSQGRKANAGSPWARTDNDTHRPSVGEERAGKYSGLSCVQTSCDHMEALETLGQILQSR